MEVISECHQQHQPVRRPSIHSNSNEEENKADQSYIFASEAKEGFSVEPSTTRTTSPIPIVSPSKTHSVGPSSQLAIPLSDELGSVSGEEHRGGPTMGLKIAANQYSEEDNTQSTVGSDDDLIIQSNRAQRKCQDEGSIDKLKRSGTPPLSPSPKRNSKAKQKNQRTMSRAKEEDPKMKAMLALKDVIFRQRKRIRHEAKEKKRLQIKYLSCKMEKKQMQKRLLNQEKELERLRYQLGIIMNEKVEEGKQELPKQPHKHPEENRAKKEAFPIQEIVCQPDEASC
mmetsp:Transcript_6457/g.7420  ORF Transcript_6457/g.7420 Transcript_6457/m.7420 type:complete len:284 (-) Transcript_6457:117-968(-)